MKATLNQDQLNQIQELLQMFPIKYTAEVEKIVKIINQGIDQNEIPADAEKK